MNNREAPTILNYKPYTKDSKRLILTVGLPRSGKSTWARTQNVPIVCPDSIRLSLHGAKFIPSAEPMVWCIARIMAESLFHSHDTVILDACNITKENRAKWRSKNWVRSYAEFLTPFDVCMERAKREDYEPDRYGLYDAIERMNSRRELIGSDELIDHA
jgi:predicted kinase